MRKEPSPKLSEAQEKDGEFHIMSYGETEVAAGM